eukprot:NODE_1881_length_820_cov_194.792477_g1484_i0.p1 GENE.NODE_1881_length_820_cov_194.792477_g1484_i0~~NODE_1881_length_820_cov_194.792477_g1484_i0.p1  ORF type:complete len:193 (+),score=37.65 NODE_1881_length_820_cov_194.792477_g1484_i0:74-652(+)
MGWRALATPGDYSGVKATEEIVLQSNDKKEYVLPRTAIVHSKLLNDLLQEDATEDEGSTMVPLANVDSITLETVADYLVHYGEEKPAVLEKPLKAALPELLPEWDKDFVYKKLFKDGNEKAHGLLFGTLMAANFLGIESLRDLGCAAIANMLRGKTPEQIMEVFDVTEPFTPEEERAVEQQYPWLKENPENQ